jgi:hypothetical protein
VPIVENRSGQAVISGAQGVGLVTAFTSNGEAAG